MVGASKVSCFMRMSRMVKWEVMLRRGTFLASRDKFVLETCCQEPRRWKLFGIRFEVYPGLVSIEFLKSHHQTPFEGNIYLGLRFCFRYREKDTTLGTVTPTSEADQSGGGDGGGPASAQRITRDRIRIQLSVVRALVDACEQHVGRHRTGAPPVTGS